ncbi:endo alpha-1,4 polygalactosaminidase [Nocardia sp. NPDC051321]|uniref:endo alpha-1,4 polygalactosaminidase n=1 Tax=Nocardia sp. NPDC051321 TaxID=3364323 RepID=UPI00379C9A34
MDGSEVQVLLCHYDFRSNPASLAEYDCLRRCRDSRRGVLLRVRRGGPRTVVASGEGAQLAVAAAQGACRHLNHAQVYDIDLFENPASTVKTLHDQGRKVICYMSGGSWEPYRPDAGDFPDSVKSGPVPEWDDERWLDVKQIDVLKPLMAKRMDLCKQKGFDGVEPDWADLHNQDTGDLVITAAEQLAYNRMLAGLAHDRGLAIGLKNDLDQVSTLSGLFDFAVNEQCFEERATCAKLTPFIGAGKPVFHAEYNLKPADFCADATRLGFSSIRKNRELDAWRGTC